MSAPVCRRRGCGALLEVEIVGSLGMLRESCPRCARNARGLCRDCPAPIRTSARPWPVWPMRCDSCRVVARRAAQHRYERRRWADPATRAERLAQMRRQRAQPVVRERRRQQAILYRARNPADRWERLKRRAQWRQRYDNDPEFRTKESRRQVAWRQAKRRARRVQRELDRLAPVVADMLQRAA